MSISPLIKQKVSIDKMKNLNWMPRVGINDRIYKNYKLKKFCNIIQKIRIIDKHQIIKN